VPALYGGNDVVWTGPAYQGPGLRIMLLDDRLSVLKIGDGSKDAVL
jgi:hypothetical protein